MKGNRGERESEGQGIEFKGNKGKGQESKRRRESKRRGIGFKGHKWEGGRIGFKGNTWK